MPCPRAVMPSPLTITVRVRSRRSTSPLGRRRPWREQSSDQLGSLPKPLLLGRSCRGGEFSFDLCEHLRQRHGERANGLFEVRRGHVGFLCSGLSGHRQRPAGVGG
jgi:hypothetical protein